MQLKEASILIVDDEPTLREIFWEWLKPFGGEVSVAENGVQALEILATRPIDLIVTDIRMPKMDGIRLLKEVKNSRSQIMPSIIFISGFADIEARNAYDLGAEALLPKPIERDDLIHAIKRSLSTRTELLQNPFGNLPATILKATFESLSGALRENRIAFGRGGFSIQSVQKLEVGPVGIELGFVTDRMLISGQGLLRWVADAENLVGVELVYIAEATRALVAQLMEENASDAFIPRTTEHQYQARAG